MSDWHDLFSEAKEVEYVSDITDEEKEIREEWVRTQVAIEMMEERRRKAKKKFWHMVELRLNEFDKEMGYNEDTNKIEVYV